MRAGSVKTVYTVGHSTLAIEDFLERLSAHKIKRLADVRRYPHSRRHPQFEGKALGRSLEAAGIGYAHFEALGGMRKALPKSPNTGWKNASFRGYADYLRTPEFLKALDALIVLAKKTRTAVMCAEALPWKCHRQLIGDALAVRGFEVKHILDAKTAAAHELKPWVRVQGTELTYVLPPKNGQLEFAL
jgi:uncharacterized protein (DUF488 family)